jgi:single-stranded DNA-specific DHH superfamily exonuclease
MAISDAELNEFKERILAAKRPLFLYDDDADGLSSYLLCLRRRGDGVGIRVHSSATVTGEYVRKVEENIPDLIVVLDKPYISQEFIDLVKAPILWLDHHEPQKITDAKVSYYNPRIADDADNRCTSYWVYKALGRPEDLWIATIGTISDWQVTEVAKEFWTRYPEWMTPVQTAPQALFDTPFGDLCRIVQFNLKGDAADVRTAIKILSRIETPKELVEHTSPRAKLLYKRYLMVQKEYEKLLKAARAAASADPILFHIFGHVEISLLSELSNQLIHEFPDKIIFIGREHQGETKFSIRSAKVNVAAAVKAAMATGVRGNSGGHTLACGGNIKSDDFPKFLETFKSALQ